MALPDVPIRVATLQRLLGEQLEAARAECATADAAPAIYRAQGKVKALQVALAGVLGLAEEITGQVR